MPKTIFPLFILLLLTMGYSYADSQIIKDHKNKCFVENKGQLVDETGAQVHDVKYYSHCGGAQIYCRPGIISFVFSKIENEENADAQISEASGQSVGFPLSKGVGGFDYQTHKYAKITTFRADLVLPNSNLNATISASEQQSYYENYYTSGDANQAITNVHTFKTVTYKNIYPNIDMVLHADPLSLSTITESSGMKYEFVVHPGGEVSDIRMQWNGLNKIGLVENGGLRYDFAFGKMEENCPVSYTQDGKTVSSCFIKSGNTIRFKTGNYNKDNALIIDPVLIWSTYFGSFDETGSAVATDSKRNVYLTGATASTMYIATTGAYQTSLAGSNNAYLAKFDAADNLLWATYFGGKGDDYANTIAIDPDGNIFIAGTASSSSGIATSGSYQSKNGGGGQDAFLAKFSSTGSRIWGTYFGGNDYESTGQIRSDISGNIYIVGVTASTSNIATSGAYQTSLGGGSQDVFLAKFSGAGSLLWATYYGGDNYDVGENLCVDNLGHVYITGSTVSTKGIATSGAYKTAYSGPTFNSVIGDVFLAKFSNDGNLIWGTYYGGNGDERGYGLTADAAGNIYVAGSTLSTSGIATSGAYKTSYSGASPGLNVGDAFIAKFSSAGKLSWATYFGGTYDEEADGAWADPYGNIYINGFTTSSNGVATSGAFQSTLAGDVDVFLVQFSSTGNLKWASYMGGSSRDNSAAPYMDAGGYLYVPGSTLSSSGISTSGSYKPNYSGLYWNAFLAKFSFPFGDDAGIDSLKNPNGPICQSSQAIKAYLHNYGTNDLKSVKIDWSINGSLQTSYSFSGTISPGSSLVITLGNYKFDSGTNVIKIWSSKPNGKTDSMPTSDTLLQKILVNPLPLAFAGTSATICKGTKDSVGTAPISGHAYQWSSFPPGFKSKLADSVFIPDSTRTYYLLETISATGCARKDSVKITVVDKPVALSGQDQTICQGISLKLGAPAQSGHIYRWTSKPAGFVYSGAQASVSPASSTNYILSETITATGCHINDTVHIIVNPLPSATCGIDHTICQGDSTKIGSDKISGDTYQWSSKPSGFDSTFSGATIKPKTTTTYYLTEIISATGCSKSDSVTITVNPKPKAAFSFVNVCPGDSSIFTDISSGAAFWNWNFGDTLSKPDTSIRENPRHLFSGTGTYSVRLKVKNGYGCSDSSAHKLVLNSCVWPGDADNDKAVDMEDFLPIGIGFGTKGHGRVLANNLWMGQPSPDWDSTFSTGLNYKYADCNGDSIIDYRDTVAIALNYGLSHAKSAVLTQGSPSDPPLTIQYAEDTVKAGDTLKARIMLGNSTNPVLNIYGLKFSINGDPQLLDMQNSRLILNQSFFGSPKDEMMGMKIYNKGSSQVDIGLSRITHTNTSGFGKLATLYIPVKTILPQKLEKTGLGLSNNHQIRYNQKQVALYYHADSLFIQENKNGVNTPAQSGIGNLKIFPNPFKGSTSIQYNLLKTTRIKIALFDITGKQICMIIDEKQAPGQYEAKINGEKYHLNRGVYLLKLMLDDEVVSRQLIRL